MIVRRLSSRWLLSNHGQQRGTRALTSYVGGRDSVRTMTRAGWGVCVKEEEAKGDKSASDIRQWTEEEREQLQLLASVRGSVRVEEREESHDRHRKGYGGLQTRMYRRIRRMSRDDPSQRTLSASSPSRTLHTPPDCPPPQSTTGYAGGGAFLPQRHRVNSDSTRRLRD